MKCYKYWRMFYCTSCDQVEYHKVVKKWNSIKYVKYYLCTCGVVEDKVLSDYLLPQERTVPEFLHIKISDNYIKSMYDWPCDHGAFTKEIRDSSMQKR